MSICWWKVLCPGHVCFSCSGVEVAEKDKSVNDRPSCRRQAGRQFWHLSTLFLHELRSQLLVIHVHSFRINRVDFLTC